jgi:hypothetical protein
MDEHPHLENTHHSARRVVVEIERYLIDDLHVGGTVSRLSAADCGEGLSTVSQVAKRGSLFQRQPA